MLVFNLDFSGRRDFHVLSWCLSSHVIEWDRHLKFTFIWVGEQTRWHFLPPVLIEPQGYIDAFVIQTWSMFVQ